MAEFLWLDALNACRAANQSCVLITILDIRGSLPRTVGTKMLVSANRSHGSIGGSIIEYEALGIAREMLVNQVALTTRWVTGAAASGRAAPAVELLFEPLLATNFIVAIFGAGHVGQALVAVLSALPCRVHWYDNRPSLLPLLPTAVPPNVTPVLTTEPQVALAALPAGVFYVLASPSHQQDFVIASAVLARGDGRFCGMLGSSRKRQQLEQYLDRNGQQPAGDRLVCPIGLAGVGGRTPAEIAIAVVAQLLMARDSHS